MDKLIEEYSEQRDYILKLIKDIESLKVENTKLKQLLYLTDSSVSNQQMNPLTKKQISEYISFINKYRGGPKR